MKDYIGRFLIVPFSLIAVCASLLLFGCSRSTAPSKDATGATPTGRVVTFKIAGDVPEAFLSVKRGDAMPSNISIKLPYEATYNVHGSDRFELAAGVENGITKQIRSNLKLEVILDDNLVATAKEGEETPYLTHIIYTVPES